MKAKGYKYLFRKGSRKEICPQCGRRTFVPFVFALGGEEVDITRYGRCDREQKCGYFLYPSKDIKAKRVATVEDKGRADFLPQSLVKPYLGYYDKQPLFRYVADRFGSERALEAFYRYKVGTTRAGASVFFQIDTEGKVRTGKVMHYLPNGHRDHAHFGTWLHKKTKKDFVLEQCFFGLHLIKSGCRVAIVESEKTAVVMSIIFPFYTWLATGGKQNVQADKFLPLIKKGCKIKMYPDKGCYYEWANKTKSFANTAVVLENMKELKEGADVADLYL